MVYEQILERTRKSAGSYSHERRLSLTHYMPMQIKIKVREHFLPIGFQRSRSFITHCIGKLKHF